MSVNPQTAIVWADPRASSALDDVDAVRRVLRPDGTMWLYVDTPTTDIGTAWRFAFGLQARGWLLRSDIVWVRTAATEVENAPARGHDYIFLLALKPDYYFDAFAIREASSGVSGGGWSQRSQNARLEAISGGNNRVGRPEDDGWRNKRSVWTPLSIGDLFEPMIRAGSSEAGCCSACGAPLVRVIEREVQPPHDRQNVNQFKHDDLTSNGEGATTLRVNVKQTMSAWRWTCDHAASAHVEQSAVYVQGTMSYMAGWIGEGLHRRVVTAGHWEMVE